jgi:hypothetical protein
MANPRKPSFSPEELSDILNEALAKQRQEFEATMAAMATEAAAAKPAAKSDAATNDAKIISAFKKKGYADIVLFQRGKTLAEQGSTVTILTFQKWMELGRRPIEGEHAVKVPGYPLRLFHKRQTRIATTEERKVNFAKVKAAVEKREQASA